MEKQEFMTGEGERLEEYDKSSPLQKECKKAAEKAMNLLLQKDRTKKELEERLQRSGFSEKASQYAMQYVMSFGYINDLRYASDYIDLHKGSRSYRELRFKLLKKGIDKEVLFQAFEDYDAQDEEEALRYMLLKRLRGRNVSELSYEERKKVIAYLARKGYAVAAIQRVMQQGQL